jgi:hypothetical protein
MDARAEGRLLGPSEFSPTTTDPAVSVSIPRYFAEPPIHPTASSTQSANSCPTEHSLPVSSYSTCSNTLWGCASSTAARSIRWPRFSRWRQSFPPAAYGATPSNLPTPGPAAEPSIPDALVPSAHGVHVYCDSSIEAGHHWFCPSPPATSRLILAAAPSTKLRRGHAPYLRRLTTAHPTATLRGIWTIRALGSVRICEIDGSTDQAIPENTAFCVFVCFFLSPFRALLYQACRGSTPMGCYWLLYNTKDLTMLILFSFTGYLRCVLLNLNALLVPYMGRMVVPGRTPISTRSQR